MARRAGSADRPGILRALLRALIWLWTCSWGGFALVGLVVAITQWTGLDPAQDPETALGGISVTVFGAAMAVFGLIGLRGRGFGRSPAARSARPPARVGTRSLPRAGSVARTPMRRLAEAETALAGVLAQLEQPTAASAVPPDWITDARDAAADAADGLRAAGARLEAVEVAARHAATVDRDSLGIDVRTLRQRLDAGVEAYGALISAACRVLIAEAPDRPLSQLTDATDRLAALAKALRELPRPD